MPAGDRTGPLGMGPMTGRGAGYCAGFAVPGYMNPTPGLGRGMERGMGFGRGRGGGGGRGWRHWYYATGLPFWARTGMPFVADAPPDAEARTLRVQAEQMEKTLEDIRRRLAEIEATQAKES